MIKSPLPEESKIVFGMIVGGCTSRSLLLESFSKVSSMSLWRPIASLARRSFISVEVIDKETHYLLTSVGKRVAKLEVAKPKPETAKTLPSRLIYDPSAKYTGAEMSYKPYRQGSQDAFALPTLVDGKHHPRKPPMLLGTVKNKGA